MVIKQKMKSNNMITEIYTKIKTTNKSSDHFGKCEICDKHVSEVFVLNYYFDSIDKKTGFKQICISQTKLPYYGHKNCLKEKTEKPINLKN